MLKVRLSPALLLVIPAVILIVYITYSDPFTLCSCPQRTQKNDSDVRSRLLGPLAADDPRLIKIVREEMLHPPSTLPYNFTKNNKSYDEQRTHHVSIFIRDCTKQLFGHEKGKIFVEAGALDGEILSNTLWLEEELGWTGLLVEPNPEPYQSLLQKRRKSWTSNACLSTSPYPERMFLEFSTASMSQIGYWHWLGMTEIRKEKAGQRNKLSTTCIPVETFMLALNITVVDYFSLDVQGAEVGILRNFPWGRIKVRCWVIEYYTDEADFKDLGVNFVGFMKSKGYNLTTVTVEQDYIFILESDADLIDRASKLPSRN